MKKHLLLIALSTLIFHFQSAILHQLQAQTTWQLLPHTYPDIVQSTKKIFASPDDFLIAAHNHTDAPSHVSTDGGTTWQPLFMDKPIVSAEFGPDGTTYLVTSKRYMTTQLYNLDTLYSSPNGTAWTNLGKIPWSGNTHDEGDFVISGNNTLLFPYTVGFGAPNLSTSTDNGANWTNTNYGGDMTSIATSHTTDTIIVGAGSNGVQYSHDAGATFTAATGGNWGASIVGGAEIAANGDVYVATAGQAHRSTDGGQTFTSLSPNPWMPILMSEFIYASNNKFYFYGTYGVFESADCITWTDITGNLAPNTPLIRDIAISDNYIYAILDTLLYRTELSGATGITDLQANDQVEFYPNPASDNLHIYSTQGGTTSIKVHDITGNAVLEKVIYMQPGITQSLDISQLSPGMYSMQVKNDRGGITMKKVLIQ